MVINSWWPSCTTCGLIPSFSRPSGTRRRDMGRKVDSSSSPTAWPNIKTTRSTQIIRPRRIIRITRRSPTATTSMPLPPWILCASRRFVITKRVNPSSAYSRHKSHMLPSRKSRSSPIGTRLTRTSPTFSNWPPSPSSGAPWSPGSTPISATCSMPWMIRMETGTNPIRLRRIPWSFFNRTMAGRGAATRNNWTPMAACWVPREAFTREEFACRPSCVGRTRSPRSQN